MFRFLVLVWGSPTKSLDTSGSPRLSPAGLGCVLPPEEVSMVRAGAEYVSTQGGDGEVPARPGSVRGARSHGGTAARHARQRSAAGRRPAG